MKVVVAGASGLVGNALVPALRERGHEVLRLVRRTALTDGEVAWNPDTGELDAALLEGASGIINLCGENIAGGRWTSARRKRIWDSRVEATRTLVAALDRFTRKPAVFLNASAIGIYGDRGDEELTEESAMGHGFLPETCLAWETHAEGAARKGVRTVLLRFGVVLSAKGGALRKMLPVFRLGLGGRLGDGRQWFSWVSLDDAVVAILHALGDERSRGPVNVVAPGAVTNEEFAATLAAVLGRPALCPVPAAMLQLIFGEMARATMLTSTRVLPRQLMEQGFQFQHANLGDALRAAKL